MVQSTVKTVVVRASISLIKVDRLGYYFSGIKNHRHRQFLHKTLLIHLFTMWAYRLARYGQVVNKNLKLTVARKKH